LWKHQFRRVGEVCAVYSLTDGEAWDLNGSKHAQMKRPLTVGDNWRCGNASNKFRWRQMSAWPTSWLCGEGTDSDWAQLPPCQVVAHLLLALSSEITKTTLAATTAIL
jgi:hypothetical protein